MNVEEFIATHQAELSKDHGWELKFVDRVLRHVPDLDFQYVDVQTPLRDRGGVRRRIDFTITEPNGVKVAMEVDGYDKTNSGTGMTLRQFVEWSRREQEIVSQGWRLLRFANTEVKHNPGHCVDSIKWTLALARGFADKSQADATRATALENELRQVQARAAEAEARLARLVIEADGQAPPDTFAEELVEARALVARDRAAVGVVMTKAIEEVLDVEVVQDGPELAMTRLGDGIDRGELDLFNDALRRAEHFERENKNMKTLVASLAAIAVSIAVIVGILAAAGVFGDSDEPSPSSTAAQATRQTGGSPSCNAAVPWQEARKLIGQSGTVVGPILSGTYRDKSRGKPTFLNMGAPFGDDRGFTVVIFGDNRSKFGGAPESDFDEQTIAVTGQVTEYSGRPQMVINTPSAIERCAG